MFVETVPYPVGVPLTGLSSAELFDWQIDTDNALGYGTVERETNAEGGGIGGGIGGMPEGMPGH